MLIKPPNDCVTACGTYRIFFDCTPRLIKLLSSFRAAQIFLFLYFIERYTLAGAQSFLGYTLSTKLSLRILFSSESYAHSVTGSVMMSRRQL